TTVVSLVTAAHGWGMGHRRWAVEVIDQRPFPGKTWGLKKPEPHLVVLTYDETATQMELLPNIACWPAAAVGLQDGIAAAILAFQWFWPAVLWGTLTFCALFHLMSACFRRPAVVAIVYSFFLETILGNMPGYMKRVSISFYTRCLMFEPLDRYGVPSPEKGEV